MDKKEPRIIPSWPARMDANLLHYGFCALDPKNPVRRLELGEGRVEFVALADPGEEPAVPNHVDHRTLINLLSLAMASPKSDGRWNAEVSGMTVGRFLKLSGGGNATPKQYARFSETLRRYMAVQIRFKGVFRTGSGKNARKVDKAFHVIDSYEVVQGSGRGFRVVFNREFMDMLRDSRYYRWVSGKEYSRMTSPVSIRLFELLEKSFMRETDGEDRPVVRFDACDLANRIPLKDEYPSQISRRVTKAFAQVEDATCGRYEMRVSKSSGKTVFDFFLDPSRKYRPFRHVETMDPAMPFEDDAEAGVMFRLGKVVDTGSEKGLALADIWIGHCREHGFDRLNDALADAAFRVASLGDVPADAEHRFYLDFLAEDEYRDG